MSIWDITDEQAYELALARLSASFDTMVDQVDKNVEHAVTDVALDCLGRAMARAPIESGDLRNSGYASQDGQFLQRGAAAEDDYIADSPPGGPQVTRAVVGFALPYAHKQHEDLSLSHDRTDGYRRADGTTVNMVAGGQAKYLDSVVVENADRWSTHIANSAKQAVEEV